MKIQISSGQGPAECEYAVCLLANSLCKEYPGLNIIQEHKSKFSGYCTSIILETDRYDLSDLEGSIQWICKSPFRPNHGRKNWFIDVSIIYEAEELDKSNNIKIESFHCGGNGGQNVNKVETGIRVTHIPTGIVVTSTEERSQYLNKMKALEKLKSTLEDRENSNKQKEKNDAWREHTKLVRGNPIRVYKGIEFKRTK